MAEVDVRVAPEPTTGLDWGFVFESWAIAALASVLSTVVLGGILEAIMGVEESVGAVYVVATFATFISFWLVVDRRLPGVAANHFGNGLAVGVLHLALALVATVVTLVATGSSLLDFDASEANGPDGAMLLLFAIERTGIVAVLGSLLAVGTAGGRMDRDDRDYAAS